MASKDYNWLDDPFDEKKNAAQSAEAQRASRRYGCLLAVLVVLAFVLLAIPVMAFSLL